MKLKDTIKEKKIVCAKCGKDEFVEVNSLPTKYTSVQIFCADEKCKTDILVPVKSIIKGIIVKK